MGKPVAITGIGCIGAPGRGLEAQTAALRSGTSFLKQHAIAGLPLSEHVPLGVVNEPLPPLPRTAALGAAAAEDALQIANLHAAERRSMGLIVGTSTAGMPESEAAWFANDESWVDNQYRNQPAHRTGSLIARHLGITGPRSTHSVACTSAACAIVEGMEWIRQGRCARVLVVGCDANTRLTLAGFSSLQLIDPNGCRPLTEERSGMNLGEGAGALVLEHPDSYQQRNARVLASLIGWGMRADGYHPTSPDPEATELRNAITDALSDANIAAPAISYMNCHGTGTRDNDRTEATAAQHLFPDVPIASSKRIYGHTMGAAGAVEAVVSCLALIEQQFWVSAGSEIGTPLADINVVQQTHPGTVDCVLSTNLAFGGNDTALVFAGADRCA